MEACGYFHARASVSVTDSFQLLHIDEELPHISYIHVTPWTLFASLGVGCCVPLRRINERDLFSLFKSYLWVKAYIQNCCSFEGYYENAIKCAAMAKRFHIAAHLDRAERNKR